MNAVISNNNYFPLCTQLEADDCSEIALGMGAGIASFCGIVAIESTGIFEVCEGTQDALKLFEWIADVPNIVVRIAFKVCFLTYAVFIGPWLEEYLFREVVHNFLGGELGSTVEKVMRIVLNGIIFGLAHLSPFQGMANIPIFVVTASLGMVFAALRMWREDRVACTTAHMTYNGLALLPLLV